MYYGILYYVNNILEIFECKKLHQKLNNICEDKLLNDAGEPVNLDFILCFLLFCILGLDFKERWVPLFYQDESTKETQGTWMYL